MVHLKVYLSLEAIPVSASAMLLENVRSDKYTSKDSYPCLISRKLKDLSWYAVPVLAFLSP